MTDEKEIFLQEDTGKTTNHVYDPDEALKLSHQLCFPLYAAARKVTGLYTPYLKPLGITYTQYIVFLVLWEKDHIPVSQICDALHLDSGTITPLLKKLEQQGYITRQREPEDERKVIVTLTQKGRELKGKAAEIPLRVGSCIRLAPEQARTLYEILYQIIESNPVMEER